MPNNFLGHFRGITAEPHGIQSHRAMKPPRLRGLLSCRPPGPTRSCGARSYTRRWTTISRRRCAARPCAASRFPPLRTVGLHLPGGNFRFREKPEPGAGRGDSDFPEVPCRRVKPRISRPPPAAVLLRPLQRLL
jgi:hypothetical protein